MRTGPRDPPGAGPVHPIRSVSVHRGPGLPLSAYGSSGPRGADTPRPPHRHEGRGQPWLVEAVLLFGRRVPGRAQSQQARLVVRLERSRPPFVHHLFRGVSGRWEAMEWALCRARSSIWFAECEDEAMTLAKRQLVRRLVGVGVAAVSIVIGVETPALALPPTITSFSPTSGPAGCVVVIKGSNFDNPVVSSVDIGGTQVASFKIVSATEIWATVAGATSAPIHLTNASDTANSPTDFTNTNPGACSPTIKSLTPCAGSAGTTVVITGTNLLKDSGTTTTAAVGGDVRFAPYAATATHTGAPETPKQLSVLVPSDAADGPIRVSTFNDVVGEGAVLSGTAFQVPPPDSQCWPPSVEHARTFPSRSSAASPGGGSQ